LHVIIIHSLIFLLTSPASPNSTRISLSNLGLPANLAILFTTNILLGLYGGSCSFGLQENTNASLEILTQTSNESTFYYVKILKCLPRIVYETMVFDIRDTFVHFCGRAAVRRLYDISPLPRVLPVETNVLNTRETETHLPLNYIHFFTVCVDSHTENVL